MSAEPRVRLQVEGAVATITIEREKALNALDPATLDELEAAIGSAGADPAVRGVIITGQGEKAFVAGADLKHMAETRKAGKGRELARRGQAVLRRIETCPRPVIACVNGFALGGGLELALACHLRYASKNAKLGLPEVGLGLIPGYGGTQRLARIVGRGRATELVISGDKIDAAEAHRIGLVNRVFETKADMLAGARALLATVGKNGPVAVRLALEAIDRGLDRDIDAALAIEADLFAQVCTTDDSGEGIAAFVEKREPKYTGR